MDDAKLVTYAEYQRVLRETCAMLDRRMWVVNIGHNDTIQMGVNFSAIGDATPEDAIAYGTSLLEAARLNEQVKQAMESLDERDEIAAVKLNTDYPYPDTRTKRYRYQAVFDITHY
ncbi:hypothetical protein H6B33_03215 [Gemmiger formicilis]|uniref:hypothetical protein n=1 Tax=Gemmiger formicilis TaxID=745368 RepID=UPI00195DB900|nr:hypothetical protein [Gemmiger formicilis]MBM6914412.1 hypothetical protein [Gemmiger formicilis]